MTTDEISRAITIANAVDANLRHIQSRLAGLLMAPAHEQAWRIADNLPLLLDDARMLADGAALILDALQAPSCPHARASGATDREFCCDCGKESK